MNPVTQPLFSKLKLSVLGSALAVTSLMSLPLAAQETHTTDTPPNIIFMIGDGMGFEYISAYRYALSDLETAGKDGLQKTAFDDLLTGAATTYPEDDTWVTDSASSATALATGHKSYNGAIGVDADKHPQQTLMELARENGWLTGAVSTSQVTHATPASFFTHHPSRSMYNQIADSLATPVADGQWSFDVMLGGGLSYFQRDDKDWLPELADQGMTIATEFDELADVNDLPALGLFAPVGLPHALDDEPRLAEMTEHALRLLTDNKDPSQPFALMIEGSQIDWCGHANDIACAVHEMDDFAKAIDVVRAYQKEHPNTLLVITADHSTGGLTLGRDGVYEWHGDRVMGITATVRAMTKELSQRPSDEWQTYLESVLNLPLTDDHWDEIKKLANESDDEKRADALSAALVQITAELTGTGWTTSGHTAVDVPVMAAGPHADEFRGYMDNIAIGQALLELVK